MRLYAISLVLLVAACAPPPPPIPTFRDTSVPISSTTRFNEERFAGDWFVVADFNPASSPELQNPIGARFWTFEARAGREIGIARSGNANPPHPHLQVGPGQFDLPKSGLLKHQSPVWVLWVDEDFQTAVLGTPNGSFGAILNRTQTLRTDRLAAARDVLAFNGYDVSKLRKVSQ